MATSEEIARLKERARALKAYTLFLKDFHGRGQGFKAILTCLDRQDRPMSSRELMHFLPVSSARMAVVIRKMEEKGLIEKRPDPHDGRSHQILLTDKGRALCRAGEEQVRTGINNLIDEVGFERIMDCLDTLELIYKVGSEQHLAAMANLKKRDPESFELMNPHLASHRQKEDKHESDSCRKEEGSC